MLLILTIRERLLSFLKLTSSNCIYGVYVSIYLHPGKWLNQLNDMHYLTYLSLFAVRIGKVYSWQFSSTVSPLHPKALYL